MPKWEYWMKEEREASEEVIKNMLGIILKADLRTIRNIWDRAGDISKEKDFINHTSEEILNVIGAPLNKDWLNSFISGRGG